MGYGSYDTKLGVAGYNVDDVCHRDGCTAEIDRGLSYLCGDQPGDEFGEYGCGRWFCGRHLRYPAVDLPVSIQQCPSCFGRGWACEDCGSTDGDHECVSAGGAQ